MNQSHKKLLILCYFGLIVFWGSVIVIIGSISLPYNPTSHLFVSRPEAFKIRSLLPEGFSFFTRDPREPLIRVFKELPEKEVESLTIPNSDLSNLGGLLRKNRAFNMELGVILSGIKNKPWRKFTGTPFQEAIASDSIPVYELKTKEANPLLCGTFYIQSIEKVPWAWINSYQADLMPSHIVKVRINCSDQHANP